MSNTASLELKVTSDGVVTADKRLQGLTATSQKTEKATDGLAASFKSIIGPLIATASAGAALHKVIAETKAYDSLIARLSGVTGSANSARIAFNQLEEISDSTIFTENEMAAAFIRMQQTGLDPSGRALKSFSNIASATGKSLESLTELTLSASMGVFRGLKDLGIKAEAEGTKVRMTYKGITTEITNSAEAIQEYLVKIGETDFAGAAAAQLDTMGGSIKRIEDAWGDLFREVGRSPVGDAIKSGMTAAAEALNGITSFLTGDSVRAAILKAKQLNVALWSVLTGEDAATTARKMSFATLDNTPTAEEAKAFAELQKRKKSGEIFTGSVEDLAAGYDPLKGSKSASAKARSKALYEPDIMRGRDSDMTPDYEVEGARGRDSDFAALADKARAEATARAQMREQAMADYRTEEEQIQATHERRQQMLQDALKQEALTRAEFNHLMAMEEKKAAAEREAYNRAQAELAMQGAAGIFQGLATVAKNASGEQSASYRALFAMSKAFATAQSTVAMFSAMSSGMQKGWPEGIPLMLSAAAQGAQILASISSTSMYDKGGDIMRGKGGIVGEYGPEFVDGPARVTSRKDTAAIIAEAVRAGQASGGGGQGMRLVVAPNQEAAAAYMSSAAGERTWLAIAQKNQTTIRQIAGIG